MPAPRVSVGASAPGLGLGRRSRAPGRLEPPQLVPGRPLPSPPPPPPRPPEAARGRGHVSSAAPPPAGPLWRRPGETQRDSQEPISGVLVRVAGTPDCAGARFFFLVWTTQMGLSGPRPVWPISACPSPANSAGRLAGRPEPHVLLPPCRGSGDGQVPSGPLRSQHWVRAPTCRSSTLTQFTTIVQLEYG